MPAAVYYRVSTDKQDKAMQVNSIKEFLLKLPSVPAVLVYEDVGSGAKDDRPAFQRLLADAAAGAFDTLYVYRLDRLSRNAGTAIRTILDLDVAGIAFVSVTQPVLNLGHENPFRRTMLAAFAEIGEIERQTIRARVKDGLSAARARGVRLGKAPQIESNPELSARVLELLAQDLPIRKIAALVEVSYSVVQRFAQAQKKVAE